MVVESDNGAEVPNSTPHDSRCGWQIDEICKRNFDDCYIGPPRSQLKHDAKEISSYYAGKIIWLLDLYSNLNRNFVFEGAYIDILEIYNKIDLNKNIIIGLTYNNLSNKELFDNIKKYDRNEWTNEFDDKTLKEKVDCFINRNKYYNDCFKDLNIIKYDVSSNRNIIFDKIIDEVKKDFIGNEFEIIIDRPINSHHPKYDMIYPVNYGYIPNTKSSDNEEIDCYLLGVNEPVEKYTGTFIAIIKRIDDNDDKLIIVPKGFNYTDSEIEELIYFQEKYFSHTIIR